MTTRTIRAVCAFVALVSACGLVALSTGPGARAAGEGELTDSAVTITWAGGNGDLQRYQPDHAALTSDGNGNDAGSGHWDDFKNLKVTVSQTEDLIDQTVVVTASGIAGSVVTPTQGVRNFLQVFQCWGPNPNAADFAETCQFGGYSPREVGGESITTLGNFFQSGTLTSRGEEGRERKFRTVNGEVNKFTEVKTDTGFVVGTNRGLGAFFSAGSSNELPYVPVGSAGTARASFVAQSAAAQPYLGCGDPKAAGERCWLVVVPRGTHSGTRQGGPKCGFKSNNEYGEARPVQEGSSIEEACSHWDDRVVVPLDFRNPYQSCPAGSAERRVAGSELIADAMSSWQTRLCAGGGATYSLNTNSGNLTRAQLLTGTVDFAAVTRPLTPETIGTIDPALLEDTDLGYAPLANSALTIGFVAEGASGTIHRRLRLTPRLLAKMMTQSYQRDVPAAGNYGDVDSASFAVLGMNTTVTEDEEWVALGNPRDIGANVAYSAWVVSGPRGDDAIRLLWEYVQADADAVAFLRGSPDPWGNVINPYYLQPDNPASAGGGYPVDISTEPLDIFPKADQSLAPTKSFADAQRNGMQVDSTAYSPYSETLEANANRVLRVYRKGPYWEPQAGPPERLGAWAASPPEQPGTGGGRLLLGPTLAPSAEKFEIATASLPLPLKHPTTAATVVAAREFVSFNTESMAKAIESADTDERGLTSIDLTSLPSGAYPLTTTVHAAVDVGSARLDAPARVDYAALLRYAAGEGNQVTGDRGGLPEGYLPLTGQQSKAALALAKRLTSTRGGDSGGADGSGSGSGTGSGPGSGPGPDATATAGIPGDGDGANVDAAGGGPGSADGPAATSTEASAIEKTARMTGPVALGGTLLAGLIGMVGAPFLMRRRPELTG